MSWKHYIELIHIREQKMVILLISISYVVKSPVTGIVAPLEKRSETLKKIGNVWMNTDAVK